MKHDVYIEIKQAMLEVLVAGKEIKIEQPDGSHWHFKLENMGFEQLLFIVNKFGVNLCGSEIPKKDYVSCAQLDMQDKLGRKLN